MRKRGELWIGGVLLLLLLVGCGNSAVDNSAKPSSTVGDNAEEEVTETETMGEQLITIPKGCPKHFALEMIC